MSPEEVSRWISALRSEFGSETAPDLILDLQGSKWRVGETPTRQVAAGEVLTLLYAESPGAREPARNMLSVPHPDFFSAAAISPGRITMNDAKVELQIVSCSSDRLECRVTRGGPISGRKGISLPGSSYRREGLHPRDARIVRESGGSSISYAISYVRDAEELGNLKKSIPENARLTAKIERPEAVADALAIAAETDEIWLCRGDLGAEVGGAQMARIVHTFYPQISRMGVPTVLAGQVLEHMTDSPDPTRAELCNLFDALTYGMAGVVLSDETAVGSYPVESCAAASLFRSGT